MNATLISFDGFVRQMAVPEVHSHSIRIPTMRRQRRGAPLYEDDVWDMMTDTVYEVREFHQVGNTSIYEER